MEKEWFTISVYSENHVGLLNRISGIFLKRHINIESLNVSKSEIEGVSKFTIVIFSTEDWAIKIVNQIEKQVEVIKAYYHTDEETIYQESALFKIASALLFDERHVFESRGIVSSKARELAERRTRALECKVRCPCRQSPALAKVTGRPCVR